MKFGDDGRLYAVNPEAGFFGVAPNTSHKTNPNAMETIERNTIFTNCAKTDDGDIWWEGMTGEPPAHAIDWHGNDWTPESEEPGRPSERPLHDPGLAVPLDRARVGGPRRRADRRLPVRRPPRHRGAAGPGGVRLGARRLPGRDDVVETTAAAGRRGRQAALRPDGDAARSAATTWPTTSPTGSKVGRREGAKLPRVFLVNWFRKDADGKFLWPGFGENSRVLEWVFRRCEGEAEAVETPIGLFPRRARSTPTASTVSDEAMRELLTVDDADRHASSSPRLRSTWRAFGDQPAGRRSARSSRRWRGVSAPTEPEHRRPLYERAAIPLISSRPGSWFYIHVAPHLDRGLLRLTGGRLTTAGRGRVGFLKVRGARSGVERITPLVWTADGEDVAAGRLPGRGHQAPGLVSKPGGQSGRPVLDRRRRARLSGEDCRRQPSVPRLWELANRRYPGYAVYQRRAGVREIPIVVLEPRS